jgi:hypothetical protein
MVYDVTASRVSKRINVRVKSERQCFLNVSVHTLYVQTSEGNVIIMLRWWIEGSIKRGGE